MADISSPASPVQTGAMWLGANLDPATGECVFRVWAPGATFVQLQIVRRYDNHPFEDLRRLPQEGDSGYYSLRVPGQAGDRYSYIIDGGRLLPDPASRMQAESVHTRSTVIDPHAFRWTDSDWRGIPLRDYIIYELHIGTFTPEGTFDAAIRKLQYLRHELGVTAIEIMPVAAFPGERNWGYDGVSLFAVQASYGGPEGLRRLVDAAHRVGLAVVLDVVYNHLGNEGNYLREFGPYFTDHHKTPWGDAVNYDAPGCAGVRRFVVENALYWLREYHIDGLRLDAVQTIHDDSPRHILAEIRDAVAGFAAETGREICIIAESDENDSRLVRPASQGGFGLDAFWSDDFHHCIHTLLTGENAGYYQDFGSIRQLAKALREGYVFQGEEFKFWQRPRGTVARSVRLPANVICIQNHDQVGNRAKGERLPLLSSLAQRQAAAALLLLAPHTPLLFMGQEWDEAAPFLFFTSFGNAELVEAVRKGRREEFKDFAWDEVPDPQAEETFLRSKLDWKLATRDNPALDWYKALIKLRKESVMASERTCFTAVSEHILTMQVPAENPKVMVIVNLKGPHLPILGDGWKTALSAADEHAAVVVATK